MTSLSETTRREHRVAQSIPHRRPRRRPGRWQSVLGIVLILAVVLAVADRAAAAAAESEMRSRIAAELQARQVSYATLDVGMGGTPFLTQVARGRYDSIAIDITDVRLQGDGREAMLPALHVVATGVEAQATELMRGNAPVTAEQVVGSGVVSYTGLSALVDLSDYYISNVTFTEQDGALYASGIVSVVGLEIPISAVAEVTVQAGQIQLGFRDASASGMTVPDVALPVLDRLANAVIVAAMPPLPFDITIDALTVTPDGLAITATGRQVSLVTPR